MAKRERKPAGRAARPIKTKRDYERAKTLISTLSDQTGLDSTAELRLQSLLQELDKFDEPEDETNDDAPEGTEYSGLRRRWSDD